MQQKEESNENAPHISVNVQYIKDCSFESPNAPRSFFIKEYPDIDLTLDVSTNKVSDQEHTYEVAMEIEANVSTQLKDEKIVLFHIQLVYAGIFSLTGFTETNIAPALMINCPTILFPYARKIIGDMTSSGGFQPLLIDPVDFTGLFLKKIKEQETINSTN